MRYRRSLQNDKGDNRTKGYTICKCLCTQYKALKYVMQILTYLQGEIDSNTMVLGDSNIPLTSMDR